MNAERVTYLDSSAIVKLVVSEPEAEALRRRLSRRRLVVSSSLARTEVLRAVLLLGPASAQRAHDALRKISLLRLDDRLLDSAGSLAPAHIRSLDAIHLATARRLGDDLRVLITYDERMADTARELGMTVESPT
jgi:predicted nucleic acid-binding protein